MITAYQGKVRDGQIRFDNEPELPEGAQVILVVVSPTEGQKALTLGTLLDSPLTGMWADRTDITDSAEFARQLREHASQRRE